MKMIFVDGNLFDVDLYRQVFNFARPAESLIYDIDAKDGITECLNSIRPIYTAKNVVVVTNCLELLNYVPYDITTSTFPIWFYNNTTHCLHNIDEFEVKLTSSTNLVKDYLEGKFAAK